MNPPADAEPSAAHMLAEHVQQLAEAVGVPRGLRELGVHQDNVERLAATAMTDACLATNPRPVSRGDLVTIFQAAL